MPPHQVFYDGEEINFPSQVAAAFYGPSNPHTATNPLSKQLTDVTTRVQELIAKGRSRFVGGLHTALKFDPCPGQPKILFVYFANQADLTVSDGETVKFPTSSIVKAYYSREDDVNAGNVLDYKDVTDVVKKIVQSGRTIVEGGIHTTAVSDPFPNKKKLFLLFLA